MRLVPATSAFGIGGPQALGSGVFLLTVSVCGLHNTFPAKHDPRLHACKHANFQSRPTVADGRNAYAYVPESRPFWNRRTPPWFPLPASLPLLGPRPFCDCISVPYSYSRTLRCVAACAAAGSYVRHGSTSPRSRRSPARRSGAPPSMSFGVPLHVNPLKHMHNAHVAAAAAKDQLALAAPGRTAWWPGHPSRTAAPR